MHIFSFSFASARVPLGSVDDLGLFARAVTMHSFRHQSASGHGFDWKDQSCLENICSRLDVCFSKYHTLFSRRFSYSRLLLPRIVVFWATARNGRHHIANEAWWRTNRLRTVGVREMINLITVGGNFLLVRAAIADVVASYSSSSSSFYGFDLFRSYTGWTMGTQMNGIV